MTNGIQFVIAVGLIEKMNSTVEDDGTRRTDPFYLTVLRAWKDADELEVISVRRFSDSNTENFRFFHNGEIQIILSVELNDGRILGKVAEGDLLPCGVVSHQCAIERHHGLLVQILAVLQGEGGKGEARGHGIDQRSIAPEQRFKGRLAAALRVCEQGEKQGIGGALLMAHGLMRTFPVDFFLRDLPFSWRFTLF